MSKRHRHPERPIEPRLPPHLAKDLRDLYQPPLSVTTQVEEKIAEMAWRQCEAIKARRRVRRWGQFGALAAAIVLVVWLGDALQRPDVPSPTPPPLVGVEDIDRNGHVDILDAFVLARRLQRGGRLNPQWDVNRDGIVDHTDVDAVATAAVRLNGGAP